MFRTYKKAMFILLLISVLLLCIPSSIALETPPINMDFYYATSCPSCDDAKEFIITEFQDNPDFDTIVQVTIKDVDTEEILPEWRDVYDFFPYPFVVISSSFQKTSEISEYKMSASYLESIIYEFLFNLDIIPCLLANQTLNLDFYVDENCMNCTEYLDTLTGIQSEYSSVIILSERNVDSSAIYHQQYVSYAENNSALQDVPFLIISCNDSVLKQIPTENISTSVSYLSNVLLEYVHGVNASNKTDPNIIETPFGEINISDWSLPLLTIILGGMDSFNPCAFFILIFLLNLLIYAGSRRRMLLIGGIFIFFSGFLYMLFMFVMYEVFRQLQTSPTTMLFLTIGVGAIVLPMGLLNIKDFFFFKKGASLSIPDEKKPKIYKQMRLLIKNPKLSATIIGTIILAGTVNFYELLCTLGLPFAYTKALSNYSITQASASYYGYILLYNIVYVIPLIIIVLSFVITLGKRKLSEWHGQVMKLLSGIMLSMFGIIFIVNYRILDNPVTPIILLLVSLLSTWIISTMWKKIVLSKKQ
jgi:hypothetical protein